MFTQQPNNYDSLYDEAIFCFSGSVEGDRRVEVINNLTDETLLVKKFYSTADYQLNVAPVVKSLTYPTIVTSTTGFIANSEIEMGVMKVHIEDEESNQSDSVILTHSKQGEPDRGVVSSLPTSRTRYISVGERDLVRLYLEPNEAVSILQCQYLVGKESASAYVAYQSEVDELGFATFSLVAEDLALLDAPLDRIELVVSNDAGVVDTVRYQVIDAPYEPLRLAWVSSCSTIEHYTFPNIVEQRIDREGVRRVKVASAPESDFVRGVITEAVESSRLWVATEGGYREARMVSESVDITSRAKLASVQFEVEYGYEC